MRLYDRLFLSENPEAEEDFIADLNPESLVVLDGVKMEPERNYKFGVALVDKNNPQKILGRSKNPILEATESWESDGIVSGKVVFPTGHAFWDGRYHLFYGAGDKYIAHTTISEKKLFDSLDCVGDVATRR